MKVAFSIMKQQIKSLIRRVVFKRKTFAESWYDSSGYDSRVSYKRARELKKMGFCAGKDLVYDFERFGYENYVTDRDIYRIHPINGLIVPKWDEKMEQINEIINHLYFIEYGGVDVAPTTTGLKVIEINSLPSLRLLQMDRPAFENEEFKKFLTRKGY